MSFTSPSHGPALPEIRFYRVADAYGEFSNFAPFPLQLDGKKWPTSEHYFQAQKFLDPVYQEQIRETASPMAAAKLGRSRSVPLRPDWEQAKDSVMRAALHAKFTQHPELGEQLLGTGNARLIEHTANDRYWGDGGDGGGVNRLGELLVELRSLLRNGK